MFESWQRGTELVIKRNPHYWQMGEDGKPLPYLDEVRFPVIPDDATRILKLQAGEVDGAELIPYARVAELKSDPNIDDGALSLDQGAVHHHQRAAEAEERQAERAVRSRRCGRR